jgi:non-heme chloroperoxidase
MTRSIRFALALFLVAHVHGVSAQAVQQAGASGDIRLIQVAPSVRLEVIDWGGHGPALVFLAGSGNTAHVFDHFAPTFTDSFHAFGITRRGFGASSTAPPPNDVDTLVADISSVLDSLALGTVVLVGHSIAGEELTRFGETNPTRCAGLVYLDAAYDRTTLPAVFKAHPPPSAPPKLSADSASITALNDYLLRVAGVRVPASELSATVRFDKAGHYLQRVTPDSLEGRLMGAVRVPAYERVQCRSLGIFAVSDSAVDLMPYYYALDSAGRAQGDAVFQAFRPVATKSVARFRKFPGNRVVELRRANHYVFLDRPKEVALAIRTFLAGQ